MHCIFYVVLVVLAEGSCLTGEKEKSYEVAFMYTIGPEGDIIFNITFLNHTPVAVGAAQHIPDVKDLSEGFFQNGLLSNKEFVNVSCSFYRNIDQPDTQIHLLVCNEHFRGMIKTSDRILSLYYENGSYHVTMAGKDLELNRRRRSLNKLPFLFEDTRVVELAVVVTWSSFELHDRDQTKVRHHCEELIRMLNRLYRDLRIRMSLVDIVFWDRGDLIQVTENADATMKSFCEYRSTSMKLNDHALLLSGKKFMENGGNVLGRAFIGTMCTPGHSCAVISDNPSDPKAVAWTIAHEMGHSFGLHHDESPCVCQDAPTCIMAPLYRGYTESWSDCSGEKMKILFSSDDSLKCLQKLPTPYSPACGNNFLDPGEDCDISNNCCDKETCKFKDNASCANGECCDLQSCRIKSGSNVCRKREGECDMEEYCDGQSEFCPKNCYHGDGTRCNSGQSYCANGKCPLSSHEQCRKIWGGFSENGPGCYDENGYKNASKTRYGYCKFESAERWDKRQCAQEDIFCGALFCHTKSEDAVAVVSVTSSKAFMKEGRRCRGVETSSNPASDLGMVKDGTKCGENKMCFHQKCVDVPAGPTQTCQNSCSGRRTCDSLGVCTCHEEYQKPDRKLHVQPQPSFTRPTSNWPTSWPPLTHPPLTGPPLTDPPLTRPPLTHPPLTQPPLTRQPLTRPPLTRPPLTHPPLTRQPLTHPPLTRPPLIRPPLTRPPLTRTTSVVRTAVNHGLYTKKMNVDENFDIGLARTSYRASTTTNKWVTQDLDGHVDVITAMTDERIEDESFDNSASAVLIVLFVVLPIVFLLCALLYYSLYPHKKTLHMALLKERRDVLIPYMKNGLMQVQAKSIQLYSTNKSFLWKRFKTDG